jgi:hypothetical protein
MARAAALKLARMSQDDLDSDAAESLRSTRTSAIVRGTCRLLVDLGAAPILEWTLTNGRRADIAAIDRDGALLIVEVKSCQADFEADAKWRDYLGFADRFYFAVDCDFPQSLVPAETGLIIADRYGAAIMHEGPRLPLAPARRKAALLRFARHAAGRLIELKILGE